MGQGRSGMVFLGEGDNVKEGGVTAQTREKNKFLGTGTGEYINNK